jgi:hypothetical protein
MRRYKEKTRKLRNMFCESPDVHCYYHVKALFERDVFQVHHAGSKQAIYAHWQVHSDYCYVNQLTR